MKNVYFVGIGGIGMSALARHFNAIGVPVAGYDKTPSQLTNELVAEGIGVSFDDNVDSIPADFRSPQSTLVVLTPAIPDSNAILSFFRSNGFQVVKRAFALGQLVNQSLSICVAGTHGKTTTSTLVAHILRSSHVGCGAILGGISVNYDTNYWANANSQFIVTEADEYDRSFLQLRPHLAVISAMDADHLDIYGTHQEVIKAFQQFASLVSPQGTLVAKYGLPLSQSHLSEGSRLVSYSLADQRADSYAKNITVDNGRYLFDVVTPWGTVSSIRLGLPGRHNIENCVAATSLALLAGATPDEVAAACASFRGNRRRFQLYAEDPSLVLIDDYAHHPEEIRATLSSVRELYPGRHLTVAFQPHLYTRTRDLADGFASALSIADRLLLLDIYPARELPIPGVTSQMLLDLMPSHSGAVVNRDDLPAALADGPHDVVVVMGAGNIDLLIPNILKALR